MVILDMPIASMFCEPTKKQGGFRQKNGDKRIEPFFCPHSPVDSDGEVSQILMTRSMPTTIPSWIVARRPEDSSVSV